jgi:hypothetical protein
MTWQPAGDSDARSNHGVPARLSIGAAESRRRSQKFK